MPWWVPVALLVAVAIGLVLIYNSFVTWLNRVRNGWAQIDVQLKRRHDLIPNLVEVCRAYMTYERETLESLIRLRQEALRTQDTKKRQDQETQVSQHLRQLFALAENYPQLKASENLLALQEELASTENKIAFARQFYNDCVMEYNTRITQFPGNLVAWLFGFRPQPFFQIELASERAVPEVRL
ncbi:MAG: LemA family protein [Armatimonadetes bacterium]|nr:LemA family protein [Armatimonadota bacterium]MDW8122455.1 LemA family protein [Armatimonadota bacterium]